MQGKRRITKAYRNARSLVATMGRSRGSARPCIEACLKHFNVYKNADDAAAAGWTLAAIQEQLGERNLYGDVGSRRSSMRLRDIMIAAFVSLCASRGQTDRESGRNRLPLPARRWF